MPEVKDEIRMKIEEDGTVTVSTQGFSPELHLSADQLIKTTFKDLGGTPKFTGRNKPRHSHEHIHTHVPDIQKNQA